MSFNQLDSWPACFKRECFVNKTFPVNKPCSRHDGLQNTERQAAGNVRPFRPTRPPLGSSLIPVFTIVAFTSRNNLESRRTNGVLLEYIREPIDDCIVPFPITRAPNEFETGRCICIESSILNGGGNPRPIKKCLRSGFVTSFNLSFALGRFDWLSAGCRSF